jgi:hypothetical protein
VVAVPVIAAFALHAWLGSRPDVVPLHARLPDGGQLAWLAFTVAQYLGLMTAPLLLLLPARPGLVFWVTLAVMAAAATGVAVIGQPWLHEGVFPYLDDLLTARGTYVMMEGDRPPLLGWEVRLVLSTLACVCAAALIARAAAAGKEGVFHPLVLFSALQFAALVVAPKLYDRYLLPVLVGALAVAARGPKQQRWWLGLAVLLLFGGLSVGLMHDWLSVNAARWQLGRRAAEDGIAPGDVQGGMEWDHCHPRDHAPHYRLSLSPSPNAAIVDAEPYSLWLPPRTGKVYLLRPRS